MIRSKYILPICFFIFFIGELKAQHAYFPKQGLITFEKEVYIRARMREMSKKDKEGGGGMMMPMFGNINDLPEKDSSLFTLQFDGDETLMMALAKDEESEGNNRSSFKRNGRGGMRRGGMPPRGRVNRGVQDKIYYQNLQTGLSEIELEIDEKYLLKDSLQKITWRFTDEYRNIAGYDCQRVNGATTDSLYIVAFYTDQIPVSGGPALIHGLPGMILGLAIPEMHVNYWATKVDMLAEDISSQWRTKKSKEMTLQEFFERIGNNGVFRQNAHKPQRKRMLLENLIY